ncbi:hypothetical protein GWK47_046288 [Chionoecetes opilio]|uniref:Uncharacterized protein n=1 Tax=Chionoecetes opilio TaxID=41210 RepID=A0A8J5CWF6_CHIOP|nr:hypothetical protein GWK47_046288 [Chionoecetes opilio]
MPREGIARRRGKKSRESILRFPPYLRPVLASTKEVFLKTKQREHSRGERRPPPTPSTGCPGKYWAGGFQAAAQHSRGETAIPPHTLMPRACPGKFPSSRRNTSRGGRPIPPPTPIDDTHREKNPHRTGERERSNEANINPIRERAFNLNKQELVHCDAVPEERLASGRLPTPVCVDPPNSADHTMTCKKGGFVLSGRRGEGLTASMLKEGVPRRLQPSPKPSASRWGKLLRYRNANTATEARVDICARDSGQRAAGPFLDIRVFDPMAASIVSRLPFFPARYCPLCPRGTRYSNPSNTDIGDLECEAHIGREWERGRGYESARDIWRLSFENSP